MKQISEQMHVDYVRPYVCVCMYVCMDMLQMNSVVLKTWLADGREISCCK
jgi:hypothetical protein